MNRVIKQGLQIAAGLQPASQKELSSVLHDIFTEEAHIDFNNPENVKGLKAFASLFRDIFTHAGNKNFDFSTYAINYLKKQRQFGQQHNIRKAQSPLPFRYRLAGDTNLFS